MTFLNFVCISPICPSPMCKCPTISGACLHKLA
jgi:hypothetical protein